MKMKLRPDDASMLQMNDWLAELREQEWAEPSDGTPAESAVRDAPWSATRAEPARPAFAAPPAFPAAPVVSCEPAVWAGPVAVAGPAVPAAPVVPAEAAPRAQARHAAVSVRAIIGDELRLPMMWCEMGSCISWHADPAALGEADARVRAIEAGWRVDAFGRLACPRCQQTDPNFRASHQPVPWDRYTAMARAARVVAGRSDQAPRGYQAASYQPASYQPASAVPASGRTC